METTDEILDSWVGMSKSPDPNNHILLHDIVINNNINDDIIVLLCCTCTDTENGFWWLIRRNVRIWSRIQLITDVILSIINRNEVFKDDLALCVACKFEKYPELLSIIREKLSK